MKTTVLQKSIWKDGTYWLLKKIEDKDGDIWYEVGTQINETWRWWLNTTKWHWAESFFKNHNNPL